MCPMPRDKHHPAVLKGRHTQYRHYIIYTLSMVMQSEPHSAIFLEVYLFTWSTQAEIIQVVLCFIVCVLYDDRRISETL